jgi:hypothetical protein
MIETRKKKDKEQHKFPMTKFLSLALGQNFKMLIFFSLFYGNNQNFQDQAPLFFFLYTNSAIKKKNSRTHFFLCIYYGKIKNSTRTLPYDFDVQQFKRMQEP